jgi:hypothetical protein
VGWRQIFGFRHSYFVFPALHRAGQGVIIRAKQTQFRRAWEYGKCLLRKRLGWKCPVVGAESKPIKANPDGRTGCDLRFQISDCGFEGCERSAPNKANLFVLWAENEGRAEKQSQSKPIWPVPCGRVVVGRSLHCGRDDTRWWCGRDDRRGFRRAGAWTGGRTWGKMQARIGHDIRVSFRKVWA